MSICSQCGKHFDTEGNICSACTHTVQADFRPVLSNERQGQQEHNKTEAIEAEIVDEGASQHTYEERTYYSGQSRYNDQGGDSAYGRVHGRGWQQHGAFRQAGNELSCLPAFLTLMLGVSLGMQWGFLAALGFFFFYILGSALALAVSVRRTLMGKPVLLWFNRILVWLFAYAITYSLAT